MTAIPSLQKLRINQPSGDRRNFLKKAALGGIALGGMMNLSIEDTIAQTTSKVNRSSSPSELKITDMRVAVLGNAGWRRALIKIDTNQGIYGLGEVRDGADERYALFLKSRILGSESLQCGDAVQDNQTVRIPWASGRRSMCS